MRQLLIIVLITLAAVQVGCASKKKGFELPPALSETFRGGQLKGLESATSAELGMPNQYDRVSHVCVSDPEYNLAGEYIGTSVKCW